jgi:menaquinone-dependent protoporphyrinogen IX oxidase
MSTQKMNIWIIYDSKYGNNKQIAEALGTQFSDDGNDVKVHLAKTVKPKDVIDADMLIFGGPIRWGTTSFTMKGWMANFAKILNSNKKTLKKIAGWGTHLQDKPGTAPQFTWDATALKWKALMDDVIAEKRMPEIQGIVVNGMSGPMEENWQSLVADFAGRIKAL